MTRKFLALTIPALLLLACATASPAWAGTAPPPIEPAIDTGEGATRDAYLVIGNEGYTALPQAVYAQNDARAFKGWLDSTHGVNKWRAYALENASREAILAMAKKAAGRVKSRGTMWIYFSGHGTIDGKGRQVLLGTDARPGELAGRGVTVDELVALFARNRRTARVVLVLDAGWGSISRDGLELVPGLEVEVPEPTSPADPRVVVWSARKDAGSAYAWSAAQHGLFTWSVLGALRGWADGEIDGNTDHQVTLAEAQAFTARTGLALGRTWAPTTETDPTRAAWVMADGDYLEAGPTDDLLEKLSLADRNERFDNAAQRVRAEATAFWQDTLALAQKGGAEGREALDAFIKEYEATTVSVDWVVAVQEVREARRILANYNDAGGSVAGNAAVSAASIEVLEPCDDLQALEGDAVLGKLNGGQKRCLEARVTTERLQTTKDKISRLLLVNAEASGDSAAWDRLMIRHLRDIDRSDPDLAMRYSVYLFKGGLDSAEDAIHWADISLENKQIWEGEEYVKKVYGLYRLRAEAASLLWTDAEKNYRADPNPEHADEAEHYRGWAKDFAREWLDYARASGRETDKAFNLCTSAAGTQAFCKASQ